MVCFSFAGPVVEHQRGAEQHHGRAEQSDLRQGQCAETDGAQGQL